MSSKMNKILVLILLAAVAFFIIPFAANKSTMDYLKGEVIDYKPVVGDGVTAVDANKNYDFTERFMSISDRVFTMEPIASLVINETVDKNTISLDLDIFGFVAFEYDEKVEEAIVIRFNQFLINDKSYEQIRISIEYLHNGVPTPAATPLIIQDDTLPFVSISDVAQPNKLLQLNEIFISHNDDMKLGKFRQVLALNLSKSLPLAQGSEYQITKNLYPIAGEEHIINDPAYSYKNLLATAKEVLTVNEKTGKLTTPKTTEEIDALHAKKLGYSLLNSKSKYLGAYFLYFGIFAAVVVIIIYFLFFHKMILNVVKNKQNKKIIDTIEKEGIEGISQEDLELVKKDTRK